MYRPVSKKMESKIPCRYALSVVVAKRARMIVDRGEYTEEFKPVLQAMDELEEDKVVVAEGK